MTPRSYDVAVVGGGAAGSSAALVLGRGRRSVCVIDAGAQRNLPARESHSFFTRDGEAPADLLRIGREQLRSYPTVEVMRAEAVGASIVADGFEIALAHGEALHARKLILATGVEDVLPPIPGVREHWGKAVFHCPYCHGFEVGDAPLAILLGENEDPIALAQLMRGWSRDLVLFSNGRTLSIPIRSALEERGIGVREARIRRLEASGDALVAVVLEDGERVARRAALLRPPQRPRTLLARQLGCALTAEGLIVVDADLETSVGGVYAAGDDMRRLQQLVFAAADGATAAMSANRKLLAEDWARAGLAPDASPVTPPSSSRRAGKARPED